jgi:hypothetical protein
MKPGAGIAAYSNFYISIVVETWTKIKPPARGSAGGRPCTTAVELSGMRGLL